MIKAELLQDAPDDLIKRLVLDSHWVFQEKHNGDRRLIEKQGNVIRDYNRNGLKGKGLPPSVMNAIKNHPMYQFIIDGELVGNTFFVFDILYYGGQVTADKPYSYRESLYHASFDDAGCIVPVKSARTSEEKIALIKKLKEERAEGFVAKDTRADYRPSENNQRWNYRYKFVKDLDAVVIGYSTKMVDGKMRDSVRLGCYDEHGVLHDICGATKKLGLDLRPGTVVILRYLYGTKTLDVVQPRIMDVRKDKAPHECTLSQIVVNKNWNTWGK